MNQIKLEVDGMSCQHCVNAINAALSAKKGITEFHVSLENHSVAISFNSDLISKDEIKNSIEEQGYEVHLKTAK